MKQGDIVLVPFPFTSGQKSVLRPALVISGVALDKSPDIWLVQITKNIRNDNFSVSLDINKDLTVPLHQISEIRCHKIFVAEKSMIKKPPISLITNKSVIKQVVNKIKNILNP